MTREEALLTIHPGHDECGSWADAKRFIEWSTALGLLKLEEPKSVEERVKDALSGYNDTHIHRRLSDAGLKIVDTRSHGGGG